MSKPSVVAIFDLDYTLTKRGTWGRFVWRTVRWRPYLWVPLLISTLSFQLQYKQGRIPRGAVKKNMMRWSMQGMTKARLQSIAETFAQKEVKCGLRPGGIEALSYHRQQGHRIIIASAAVDLIVRPISSLLSVDDFVSTDLAWSDDGRLLNTFASPNCYGEAKLDRVKTLLSKMGEEHSVKYFYSDSKADLPVLEFADVPIVVDPSDKFLQIAKQKKMKVQNWMDKSQGFEVVTVQNL